MRHHTVPGLVQEDQGLQGACWQARSGCCCCMLLPYHTLATDMQAAGPACSILQVWQRGQQEHYPHPTHEHSSGIAAPLPPASLLQTQTTACAVQCCHPHIRKVTNKYLVLSAKLCPTPSAVLACHFATNIIDAAVVDGCRAAQLLCW